MDGNSLNLAKLSPCGAARDLLWAAGLIFFTCAANAKEVESLDQLSARINLGKYRAALAAGDRAGLAGLPAKGFKGGIAGFLAQYGVYPNPEYSFTSCGAEDVLAGGKGPEAGCVVSLKLAKRNADGTLSDIGIRIEYGIVPGGRTFRANNSAYAEHLILGDGVLPAMLDR